MTTDARLSVGLPNHPKTKKLIRRLGDQGAWYLVRLILWTASTHSDGDLSGMSVEDIELAIDWPNNPGAFVAALLEVGFLDGTQGNLKFHGWSEHNPWAFGQSLRSAKARWNAIKRHYNEMEANRQVPEYATIRDAAGDESNPSSNASSNAASTRVAMRLVKGSNAPSPPPLPIPKPITSALQTAVAKWVEDEVSLVNRAYDLNDISAEARDDKIAKIHKKARERNAQAVSA
jgi:hypothetical protein